MTSACNAIVIGERDGESASGFCPGETRFRSSERSNWLRETRIRLSERSNWLRETRIRSSARSNWLRETRIRSSARSNWLRETRIRSSGRLNRLRETRIRSSERLKRLRETRIRSSVGRIGFGRPESGQASLVSMRAAIKKRAPKGPPFHARNVPGIRTSGSAPNRPRPASPAHPAAGRSRAPWPGRRHWRRPR